MANINETISEVAKLNPELARQIQKYVKNHSYGLVFEHNLPEAVRLYKKTACVGDTVNVLPERGKNETDENTVPWVVKSVKGDDAVIEHDGEQQTVKAEDIVPLVSYRNVIYPGLKEIDRIERGNPNDPYHMVINSENYHALEALTYAYAGKVDCIYIDPPYNTGAKDWKYNNDYVAADDQYRHSKWLAFMERRLKLAKQLLNPNDSVLIVTIDEKEYARLGLLLEQVFPESNIQMVSTAINGKGVARNNEFARVNEYVYFVRLGESSVEALPLSSDWTGNVKTTTTNKVRWGSLMRSGSGALRSDSPGCFYPVYISKDKKHFCGAGNVVPPEVDYKSVNIPDDVIALFPIHDDGVEGRWQYSRDEFLKIMDKGYVRISTQTKGNKVATLRYISEGWQKKVESGEIPVVGKDVDGSLIFDDGNYVKSFVPGNQWWITSHDATEFGSKLITAIIGKRFSFPKSLYAVEDALRFFIANKPNALIIDFFAGSGTTLHAVNLLNAEDGGHRRCICVTNNEVSADEAKKFTKQGLRQGDEEWEQFGIARYVTWPRTKCSIEGVDVNGKPLKGNYIGSDMPMADGFKANAIFCELTYESAWPIRLDRAFDAIAPILWMQAGCQGPIIMRIGKSYLTTDYYGVLFDYNQASKFCDKVKKTPSIKTVFIVTDDQRRYSNMCKRLPGVEVHRLYETFLRTFEICGEGGLD